jgi:hypothetical protein
MPANAREISSIDFGGMIGKPLTAVVDAQAAAAMTTVDFINKIGFDDDGNVREATFSYKKLSEDGTEQNVSLNVPYLTIVNVPFLRVEEARIEFNAKVSSVTKNESSSATNIGLDAEFKAKWGWGSFKMKGSFSHQKKRSASDETKREFSLKINVLAVQDIMPQGMSRVLDILESGIREPQAAA